MKKLILCSLLMSSVVLADPATNATSTEKQDLLEMGRQSRVELVKIQDKMLEQLLKIPFEKRPYIFPALFEEDLIPKKILTHPQIAIWKGKKPTWIAPQMKEYADKYLDTMSAKFYPVLDPDAWPTVEKEGAWQDLQRTLPTVWSVDLPVNDLTQMQ